MEKEELQTALEEAESALEQEENKVVRAGLELQQVGPNTATVLGQVRQEIDRRLQEKDEEFEATKKNYQRTIDSLQVTANLNFNLRILLPGQSGGGNEREARGNES